MVKRDFVAVREFGFITMRVNAKNNEILHPVVVYYFPNGDNRGVRGFLGHWKMCKSLGNKNGVKPVIIRDNILLKTFLRRNKRGMKHEHLDRY